MIQTIIQTVVATASVVTMTQTPVELPATPIQVSEEHVHVVKSGESLSRIAELYYDNTDAWTSILKDNPEITNPNRVEKGTVLKIRYVPQVVEIDEIVDVEVKEASETAEIEEIRMHDSIELEATPAATVAPVAAGTYAGGPLTEAQLTYLGSCEAGMIPDRNTGNGYYGAFQFSYGTWKSMNTGYERADLAPIEVQKDAVQRLLSRSSIFTQFPGCAKKMRAEGII